MVALRLAAGVAIDKVLSKESPRMQKDDELMDVMAVSLSGACDLWITE